MHVTGDPWSLQPQVPLYKPAFLISNLDVSLLAWLLEWAFQNQAPKQLSPFFPPYKENIGSFHVTHKKTEVQEDVSFC